MSEFIQSSSSVNQASDMLSDSHLDALKAQAKHLPQAPGVYYFYPDQACSQTPVYIGKSINIQQRVLSHIYQAKKDAKEAKIIAMSQAIEHTPTVGELGALLLEATLVKQYQPLFNRKLRRMKRIYCIELAEHNEVLKPSIHHYQLSDYQINPQQYGVFRSQRQALQCLRQLANSHHLCLKALGLESGKGPCFGYQLKRCEGYCVGEESAAVYNQRLLAALQRYAQVTWPYDGVYEIREHSNNLQQYVIHTIDQWRYQGCQTFDHHHQLLSETSGNTTFDIDHYRILVGWMSKRDVCIDC